MNHRRSLASALVAAVLVSSVASAPVSGVTWSVVATGLDNPRGMAFGPNGALYIAESGEGGDEVCFLHPEFGENCAGHTGAVTRLLRGKQTRVLSGLPSAGDATGTASGPSDVSVHGTGNLMVTIGWGGPPDLIGTLPANLRSFGWLIQGNPSGKWKRVANISGFEGTNDPDSGQPDSFIDTNPNAVLALAGGTAVVDAGGNDLLWVSRSGRISVLAVFDDVFVDPPDFLGLPPGTQLPMDPVPTSVARGPDGAYYVGLLTGFPFPPGAATVQRVVPGHDPEPYATGFTNIMDVAFGADGSLYVLEISHDGLLADNPTTGGLWRVPPGGGTPQLLLTDPLFFPGGMAIGRDAAVYVSNCSVCIDAGEVLRIVP